MGTFPSLSRSERAPHKITTGAVRAQDQFLSTVDAVTRPDSPTPSGGLARFDLETAEDVLAPQIKKIASYEAA